MYKSEAIRIKLTNFAKFSDIEKLPSIYSNNTNTEENFKVQHQEDLSKIHALEKQFEQMRCSMNANKSSTKLTTQSNMKLTTQSNMELTTQSNTKLATKYGPKYSTKSTTTYIKSSKSNSKLVAKRQSYDIDWSSSDPEQDALRNCAKRKILKNCNNITYRYTDPKLIESVIEKENNQSFLKTIGDWAICEYLCKSARSNQVSKRTENRLKVSTNIQKRIRVSPNEDVLDNDNDEQILNNNIFNVDQDEQESQEKGEQENQDEQEQENEINLSSGNEIQTVTQNNKRQNNIKLTKKGLKNSSNNIVNTEPISEFTDNNHPIKAKNNNQLIKAKHVLKRLAKN
ncbi:22235_t:CDS:2 [Gigaspora margarita]|uniref:22235_t:CDS:1 n=1 Tax=Gigaspora margarita TaxID=4874 RepID=A0ABN7V2E3_GIGMA|nr:22235_t:CDS:2 [Gigaspora margarita]